MSDNEKRISINLFSNLLRLQTLARRSPCFHNLSPACERCFSIFHDSVAFPLITTSPQSYRILRFG